MAHVAGVDLVHAGEVTEVGEVHGRLDQAVEAAARLIEDRPQVREDLLGLLLDRLAGDLRVIGPQRELPRDEHQPTGADRLRVGRALKRRRRRLRPNDRLLRHQCPVQ